jgi:hypothetical protein
MDRAVSMPDPQRSGLTMSLRKCFSVSVLTGLALAMLVSPAVADPATQPTSLLYGAQPLDAVEVIEVPPIDIDEVAFEDQLREADGLAPRFAIPWETRITPDTDPDSMPLQFRVTPDGQKWAETVTF